MRSTRSLKFRIAPSRMVVVGIALLCFLAYPASAQTQAPAPSGASPTPAERRASLRPTGPVTVTADRAEWEKGGAMVYTGKVKLVSDDLELAGDRLELRQFEDGEFEARVTGGPAVLDHEGVAADEGEPLMPVNARAATLIYTSRDDVVEVAGNAHLRRGTDEITGDNIRYDVARRRIQASGSEAGGQVKIVIQPPARDGSAPQNAAPRRRSGGDGREPQAAPSPAPNPGR